MAGIVPGLVMAAAFAVGIMVAVRIRPDLISAVPTDDMSLTLGSALLKIAPLVALVGSVMGGIYGGYFTATEAAGVGAGASLVLSVLMRRTWATF